MYHWPDAKSDWEAKLCAERLIVEERMRIAQRTCRKFLLNNMLPITEILCFYCTGPGIFFERRGRAEGGWGGISRQRLKPFEMGVWTAVAEWKKVRRKGANFQKTGVKRAEKSALEWCLWKNKLCDNHIVAFFF